MRRKTIIIVLNAIRQFLWINLFPLINIQISRTARMQNTTLAGKVSIKSDCKIKHSQLFGKIAIADDTSISKSFINGNVKIGHNSSVINSSLNGTIILSKNSVVRGSRIGGGFISGENLKIIGNGTRISGNVEVGRYTSINGPNTDIFARVNKVQIGNFCSIASNVTIQEYNHNSSRLSSYYMQRNVFSSEIKNDIVSKGSIVIGNDVWIGTQCVILSGANIGHGAIIAANSVVIKNIPPYAIAAGSPAKVLKYRFSKRIMDKLLLLNWWDWNIKKIKSNQVLFESELSEETLSKIIN